jgi:hypothetical protein
MTRFKRKLKNFHSEETKHKDQDRQDTSWLDRLFRDATQKIIISVVGGVLVYLWQMLIVPNLYPAITIIGPQIINSFQQTLSGHFYPVKANYRVRLYVYPEDGTNRYWLQSSKWETLPNGDWTDMAWFGNPYGIDMRKRPPLFFKVYAVLIQSSDVNKLPVFDKKQPWVELPDEDAFIDSLKAIGAIAISSPYRVERQPEDYFQTPLKYIKLNKQDIIMGNQPIQVTSPIRIRWEPKIQMYIEIWQEGGLQTGLEIRGDTILEFKPGPYELKFKQKQNQQYYSSTWIEVL